MRSTVFQNEDILEKIIFTMVKKQKNLYLHEHFSLTGHLMSVNSSLSGLMQSLAQIVKKSALILKKIITVCTSWACTERFHSHTSLCDKCCLKSSCVDGFIILQLQQILTQENLQHSVFFRVCII